MKQLIVFDIENSQNDYSIVMEVICLLLSCKVKEAVDCMRQLPKGTVSYSGIESDNPKYIECYMGGQAVPRKENSISLSKKRLIEKYYNFSQQMINSTIDKGTQNNIVNELSEIYEFEEGKTIKTHIPGYFKARFAPERTNVEKIEKAIKENRLQYHIRVRVEPKTIFQLQYLALFLRKFMNSKFIGETSCNLHINKKDISVVLLDATVGSLFPFCNPNDAGEIERLNESHKVFSRFLRLVAKDSTGVIYAPYYEIQKDKKISLPNLKPMDFKDAAIGCKFFPLMEITEETYNRLFTNKQEITGELSSIILSEDLLNEEVKPKEEGKPKRKALFQIGKSRYFNANDEDPRKAFLAYIAETSYKFLCNKFSENDLNSIRDTIIKRISPAKGETNNWLTFALFSFLISKPNISHINSAYQIARELSLGLQQLMQNAIQHSEFLSCYFTFYLDDEDILHLSVIDINTKQNMIENFKSRLKREADLCKEKDKEAENSVCYSKLVDGHNELINSDCIAIRHFFNKFDEKTLNEVGSSENDVGSSENLIHEKWKKFRNSDSTAHIGLLIFYQSVLKCRANFILQSTSVYENNENTVFAEAIDIEGYNKDSHVIPGTQYIISVNTREFFKRELDDLTTKINNKNYSENYGAYANYIDYSQKFLSREILDFAKNIKNESIVNADSKFRLQLNWANIWTNIFTKKFKKDQTIWHLCVSDDLQDYFTENDNCEVFLKGLFAALNAHLVMDAPIYLAITNLPKHFLELLRSTIISLSPKQFLNNAQLYFSDRNYDNYAQLFGNSFLEATLNAIQLSVEHGSELFHYSDFEMASRLSPISENNKSDEKPINGIPFDVIPFDAILTPNVGSIQTIFDLQMENMVDKDFGEANSHGCKLSDTHARLGSKVHIQSFYEMAFLFYRTTIANRTAFKILRSYSSEFKRHFSSESHEMKPLLFYSYASYSKAILTSLVEISRVYLESFIRSNELIEQEKLIKKIVDKARGQIAFASYQHNLQDESKNNNIQLYFGIEESEAGKFEGGHYDNDKSKNKINLINNTSLVLVVPISSTLTTFDKMLRELKKRCNGYGNFELSSCYTAFWVCDIKGSKQDGKLLPSEIEKAYWKEAEMTAQKIHIETGGDKGLTELEKNPYVYYYMRKEVVWESPLICSLCFPKEDSLLCEMPLVETDPTSTVPAHQIRQRKSIDLSQKAENDFKKRSKFHLGEKEMEGNNYRLSLLKDCVYHGHIVRSKNHHQFYISTQDYFYKPEVQSSLRTWLEDLRDANKLLRLPRLRIIFSPEHNTNVGFSQYVNTYYFDGSAEIISVNEDKEFRSNFICEHEMLRQTIERMHIQKSFFDEEPPVEFYFTDDSLNTGETIYKANSLLRSLLPEAYLCDYPSFLFKKCFFLIDRHSKSSKQSYVISGMEEDFHSFVHISVSNMRRQGDSCVGCKLQEEAKRLFKRSSLRNSASYWANKYQRYIPVSYDEINSNLKENAYERLILSHIAQNFIFTDGVKTRERGDYYDSIIFLFNVILPKDHSSKKDVEENHFCFTGLLDGILPNASKRLSITELLIKMLARPFFSFDYDFRIQIQSFLIIVAECYLSVYSKETLTDSEDIDITHLTESINESDHKKFLREDGRISKTIDIAKRIINLHGNDIVKILFFLNDVLFEALADLRSTFLIRKRVIDQINVFLAKFSEENWDCEKYKSNEKDKSNKKCGYLLDNTQCKTKNASSCFWKGYLAHVQRIIDVGSDEWRSVWFEHLLLTGEELTPSSIIDVEKVIKNENFINVDFIKEHISLFMINGTLAFDAAEERFESISDTQYYLNNHQLALKWTGQKIKKGDKLSKWCDLLIGKNEDKESKDEESKVDKTVKDICKKSDIQVRYEEFLKLLLNALVELHTDNSEKGSCFNISLITMTHKETKETFDVEDFQIVQTKFGKDAPPDEKQAKYNIKDRVSMAYSESNKKICKEKNSFGDLIEDGYYICCDSAVNKEEYETQQSNIEYDENHHILGNHRKPYIVIYFDNPSHALNMPDGLGRKLLPLSNVFLYISMDFSIGECFSKRNKLPWLILRDVLAYRNRIMRFLSEDFNSDIMAKHAISTQQDNVLTHERAASHATTTDDSSILQAFGLKNVVVSNLKELKYSMDKDKKKLTSNLEESSELWLLLQNYVNGQIARLFNRSFNNNENLENEEGIPALYVTEENEDLNSIFKKRLCSFDDLGLDINKPNVDNRFCLVRSAVGIFLHESLNETKPYHTERYFNTEYMRCVLLDIVLSSIKYATTDVSLLPRVNRLRHWKEKDRSAASVCCRILIFRNKENLIILNNVKSNMMDMNKISIVNEEIYRRIHDPLDYGDGHMSLFTIRKFILGIRSDHPNVDVSFRYVSYEEILKNSNYINNGVVDSYGRLFKEDNIWFQTCLPIFNGDYDIEQNAHLD